MITVIVKFCYLQYKNILFVEVFNKVSENNLLFSKSECIPLNIQEG